MREGFGGSENKKLVINTMPLATIQNDIGPNCDGCRKVPGFLRNVHGLLGLQIHYLLSCA